MGKLPTGPWGPLIGKTGNTVGRNVKGENIFSVKPHKTLKLATDPQVNQQSKFGLTSSIINRIALLVKTGFKDYGSGISRINAAVSYNAKNDLIGDAPDYIIDYSKLVFSKGTLIKPNLAQLDAGTEGVVRFSWTENPGLNNSKDADRASFMIYNPGKDEFVITTEITLRSAYSYALKVPHTFAGDEVHGYMSFLSADGKRVSDSVYLGKIVIT